MNKDKKVDRIATKKEYHCISNCLIATFMKTNNIMNYKQIINYLIINQTLKLKIIFNNHQANNFNIGFKYLLNNNEQLSTRLIDKITIPYYCKTIGQRKLNYKAATLINFYYLI